MLSIFHIYVHIQSSAKNQVQDWVSWPVRYHDCVHSLAQRVLSHIRQQELLHAGDRVGVAVSGGIDSVALLRLLLELSDELGVVLSIVHFNHKLRGAESDEDERFVADLARAHDLEFQVDGDDVAQVAAEEGISVETAARELRYGFFRYLLGENREKSPLPPQPDRGGVPGTTPAIDRILTAHTLDDQAETVLMRMIRGAGMKGLGGIHPRIEVEDDGGEICGEIMRPLLVFRHRELQQYLTEIGQPWREDSTNADNHFTRNRVRKLLVPLLEKEFNPSVAESLTELAEIARGEEDYWENEVSGWMGTAVHWFEPEWARQNGAGLVQIETGPQGISDADDNSSGAPALRSRIESPTWLVMNASVDRVWFLSELVAVQRRLVKAIGEQAGIPLEFKHIEEIVHFAAGNDSREDGSRKEISLPLGWRVVRERDALLFLTPDLRETQTASGYDYELPVPGRIAIWQAGLAIEARRISSAGEGAGYNPEHLLDAESLPGPLRVRNWHPGDRFWPAHSKAPKKIKELLQERRVTQPERGLWPVVVYGNEIVWMRGFPVPDKLRARPGRQAILIADERLRQRHPGQS
jgi:tRNA(Ile)-lysidine synthase